MTNLRDDDREAAMCMAAVGAAALMSFGIAIMLESIAPFFFVTGLAVALVAVYLKVTPR